MKRTIPILFLTLLAYCCSDFKQNSEQSEELSQLRAELDRLNKLNTENSNDGNGQIATFLAKTGALQMSLRQYRH